MTTKANKLVIVESPTKAQTIRKFLDSSFAVEASVGHIRDLAGKKSELGTMESGEKNKYSDGSLGFLGVDVNNDFTPALVVYDNKKATLRDLKRKLREADELYLATDEDREGEAIAQDLLDELKPKKSVPVKRLVFHEITEDAINEALANPRDIDTDLVAAQRARRVLDRIYGYPTSLLAQRRIRLGVSAGRVQSPTTKIIVDREIERMQFTSAEFYGIEGVAEKEDAAQTFKIRLTEVQDRPVAVSKDFNAVGELEDELKVTRIDRQNGILLTEELTANRLELLDKQERRGSSRARPPFITSTLQQESGRKLQLSSRRTMDAAQRLFQNGYITYMRTDSPSLARDAMARTREIVGSIYGTDQLSEKPQTYGTKSASAQEAHEAIRPAGNFIPPAELRSTLSRDDFAVYELIWRRTLASQMNPQIYLDTRLLFGGLTNNFGLVKFAASGRVVLDAGYTLAYQETSAEATDESETQLPQMSVGDFVTIHELSLDLHSTNPPRRWTEASIIEKLEKEGIGRPSTYTSILEAIQRRGNCIRRNNTLIPTFTGFAVVKMLEKHFPQLVDLTFSANMEKSLDSIATGTSSASDWLSQLYFGQNEQNMGFRSVYESAVEKIEGRELATIPIGTSADGKHIGVRVGKNYGPYLFQVDGDTEITVGIPDDTVPDEVTLDWASERIKEKLAGDKEIGIDPSTGSLILVKAGPYGAYFEVTNSDNDAADGNKPRRASLWPDMNIETVTETEALLALSFPKILGIHPDTGENVLADTGPYGPYVKSGSETRSIDAEDPFAVLASLNVDEAMTILAQPKRRGRRQSDARSKKELGKRPDKESEATVFVHLSGRFGPYVTDGEFNASVPAGRDPETLTLDDALDLLVAREAKLLVNPPKRKSSRTKKTKKSPRRKN